MFKEEISANEQESFEEIVKIDQTMMNNHVRGVVKETVEETMTGLSYLKSAFILTQPHRPLLINV